MDKITIIIPSYNQSQYLCDALDSALCQTLPCPIIIVDDGSTDDSLQIAREYEQKYKNVKVVSQVNKGLASARNTALMHVQTEYVLPLDADDMLMDTAVEKITRRIMDTNADIISPSMHCFGDTRQDIILDHESNITVQSFISVGNRIAYCSAYRKQKAIDIGGYSPRMTWGWEDYHFWIDMLKRGAKLSVIQEPLLLYRVRSNSMISTANQHSDELFAQIKKDHPEIYV